MPSPSSPPHHSEDSTGTAVCCMCGDHGLPRELFRCRSCRVRLQHSYCSDLYPRATAPYRRCNWCLIRELPPLAHGGAGEADRTAHHEAHGNTNKKRKAAAASAEEQRRHEDGYTWRRPPAALGYPVKKKKKHNKPAVAGAKAAGSGSDAGGGEREKKEVVRAGKAPPRVRVKVRRYKLLAEVVIGC